MPLARLGEGKRLTHETRKPLPEGIDPTLNVRSFAFLLADGFVLFVGDHPLVSFPKEVAVTGCFFVASGDNLPQTPTGCAAAVAHNESHYLASLSAQGQTRPTLYRFCGRQRTTTHRVRAPAGRLRGVSRGGGECLQGRAELLFLSQPMTVVGETPKVRLRPRRLDRS